MNALQQFRGILDGLEDGELKTSLNNAFNGVQLDFNQTIEKRTAVKDEFTEYKSNISKLIGTDDLDGITTKVADMSKGGSEDIETLKTTLKTKYEADTNELRTLLETEKTNTADLTAKHESILFDIEVEKQGLLTGFNTDNPMVKEMLLKSFKEKTILEDGKLFVKDTTTNEKARDIKTGEFLNAKSISDEMKSSDSWLPFVSRETVGDGGGMPPNQKVTVNTKASEMSEADRTNLFKTNKPEFNRIFGEK